MKLAKRLMIISITLLTIIMILMLKGFIITVDAQELSEPKYCYTNKECEIYSNKDTLEVRAISSKDTTLIKTYDDGTWSYVYYNHGELSGWIPSWDVVDGCGPTNVITWMKKFESLGKLKVTGYTPSPSENGGTGLTCTGVRASSVVGQCVAANLKFLPLGTVLYIKGIGYRTVMDTGVRGKTLDVLVNTNREAYALTGYYDVYIVK